MAISPLDFKNQYFGGLTSGSQGVDRFGGNSSAYKGYPGTESVSGIDRGIFAAPTQSTGASNVNAGSDVISRIGKINGELSPNMQSPTLANRLDIMA